MSAVLRGIQARYSGVYSMIWPVNELIGSRESRNGTSDFYANDITIIVPDRKASSVHILVASEVEYERGRRNEHASGMVANRQCRSPFT